MKTKKIISQLHRLTGFLCVVFLSGCATLSKEDCRRGDWFGLGVRDGLAGEPSNRLSDHVTACYEYGIAINNEAYFAGRERGLHDYCRIDNAFQLGLNGHPYRHVCPPAIDGLFGRYHSAAFAVYEHRAELDRIDREISSKESRLHDKKLSDKDRERIRSDLRELDHRHHHLCDDLYYHERQLNDLRHEAQFSH
ncbi:MAG: DUF2799 domain-containing protein [Methylobacter sp.]